MNNFPPPSTSSSGAWTKPLFYNNIQNNNTQNNNIQNNNTQNDTNNDKIEYNNYEKLTKLPCYICVLDFEATCWKNNEHPRSEMEIIEFPSVLYHLNNDKVQKISEFHEYVKPTLHPNLSKFCIELTGITQNTVDKGDTFNNVYERHHQWLIQNMNGNDDIYFLTCGAWDLKTQLPNEIYNKKITHYNEYKKYINIKTDFLVFTKNTSRTLGMSEMLRKLKIRLEGRHHSGIDDTRNIAKIFLHLFNHGYKQFHFEYV